MVVRFEEIPYRAEAPRCMIELLGEHRVNDAHVVGHFMEFFNRFRHPDPILAYLRELLRGTKERGCTGGERELSPLQEGLWAILTMKFFELGLVVVQIQIGRRTCHVEVDDPFGFGFQGGVFGARGSSIDRAELSWPINPAKATAPSPAVDC